MSSARAALGEGGTRNAIGSLQHGGRSRAAGAHGFSRACAEVPGARRNRSRLTKRHRALAGVPLRVQQLRPAACAGFAQPGREARRRSRFRKASLIIREGDAAGPMFILDKGRARAFARRQWQRTNLAFYRDGDFFGELSILNGSPRAASVEAFSDCQLLALDPDGGAAT